MSCGLTNRIIAFENGELEQDEVVSLFADLIQTGIINQLQGSYGRTARDLIAAGMLTTRGEVL